MVGISCSGGMAELVSYSFRIQDVLLGSENSEYAFHACLSHDLTEQHCAPVSIATPFGDFQTSTDLARKIKMAVPYYMVVVMDRPEHQVDLVTENTLDVQGRDFQETSGCGFGSHGV